MTAQSIVNWVVEILILLALAGVVVALATDDRDPSTVLAWLFVIMLLPVVGMIAYFFIGRNYRRASKKRAAGARQDGELLPSARSLRTLAATAPFSEAAVAGLEGTPGERVESTGRHEHGIVPLPADTVDIYTAGSQKFPALLEEMATAEKYIHLMYLIWEQDELTAKVTDILLDRMKAGVQVHILYDWLSCISYKKDELKTAGRGGRRRRAVLQAHLARQLPQPHEDGDHRRQDRCTAAA